MDTAKRAAEVLRDTEQRLRDLMGEAVASGEYDMVVQLTELAKGVSALATWPEGPPVSPVAKSAVQVVNTLPAPVPLQSGVPCRYAGKPTPRKRKDKRVYPRFYRQNDSLVKVAWSKREKKEYEHKAPWRVVEGLAAALTRQGANGRLFTSEDILPLSDVSDGSEVPSYQAYLALAWMRAEELLVQHGRRGYTVKNVSQFSEAVVTRWKQLPEGTAPASGR